MSGRKRKFPLPLPKKRDRKFWMTYPPFVFAVAMYLQGHRYEATCQEIRKQFRLRLFEADIVADEVFSHSDLIASAKY